MTSPAQLQAANAWRQWGRNAPLDLLEKFSGDMKFGPCGPQLDLHARIHVEAHDDGGAAVILRFEPDPQDL